MNRKNIQRAALRRKFRVRKKVRGTSERPRLSVFRSNKHIYVQVIDDVAGLTLVSIGTRSKSLRAKIAKTGNKKAAEIVGEAAAREALGVGINCVCFDRGPYKFHGRIKSLADAARKAGLAF